MQAGTLLWLLDPVRGEPTTHSLDRHPNDTQQEATERQCSKFLDSIALICATWKNGDAVSAAALEEWSPEGTIIRVARNAGLPQEMLEQVREIVEALNDIAQKGTSVKVLLDSVLTSRCTEAPCQGFLPPDAETQILVQIIELDLDKISHYLIKIQGNSQGVQEIVDWIVANPGYLGALSEPYESNRFLQWIAMLPLLAQKDSGSSPKKILAYIQWAADAKWVYSRFIKATFKAKGRPVPPWVVNIYKLGRYAVASKVLVKFAVENRSLFRPMRVEALAAPPKQRYMLSEGSHLEAALRRSVGGDTGETTMRLSRHWNVSNPEKHFCKKCPDELTVHAELQLVNFYDQNRDMMPRRRFIGVSKKSCFLCHKFLEHHPLNFVVSACHQKLYLSWLPPRCTDNKIYKQYRKLTNELSVAMESAAKYEIEQRLGSGTRRPVPLDSTAGVSLPVAPINHAMYPSDDEVELSASGSTDDIFEQDLRHQYVTTPNSALNVADKFSTNEGNRPLLSSVISSTSNEEVDETTSRVITFHVKRADDPMRQDLVAITHLVNPLSRKPCWDLLCAILATDQRLCIGFDEASEFLLINRSLRVSNARQFEACLEYLRNAQSWNNEALVYTT